MSTELVGPGGLPAIPDGDTGLEDFETTDAVIPRLTIDHKTAEFVDSLTSERFPSMEVVLLGLVKQRILWPPEMGEEKSDPLCKSLNFIEGMPGEKFPWEAAGFDPSAYPEGTNLACAACPLKEWDSHPTRSIPWCSEQHVLPLMIPVPNEAGVVTGFTPALLTVQHSGIKPSKSYLTSFATRKVPLYTVITKIGLVAQKRGAVDYAVPTFVKGPETDREQWGNFASSYRSIRTFLQTPRSRDEEAEVSEPVSAATAPAKTAGAAPIPDDEIPF